MKQFISVKWLSYCWRPALFSFAFALSIVSAIGEDAKLTWGINALALKFPWTNSPSDHELLTNQTHTVSLDHFYRAGGENLPAKPTECRISYNRQKLFIVFRCQENNLAFPAVQHGTNWFALLNSPPEQDSEFPDKVDLFVQPDMNRSDYFQFAVTLDGLKFGCKHKKIVAQADEETDGLTRAKAVDDFEAQVVKRTNEWIVSLAIPWKTIGGMPKSYFGLLPIRTRWRCGEVSSPVAFDFAERPPVDLFIETSFNGKTPVETSQTSLVQLPSDTLRWQRPALLAYPDLETKRQIWQMQQSLNQPTDTKNFAERLFLVQRWMDLLTLEGFNFRTNRGSIVDEDLSPSLIRRDVNFALQKEKETKAHQLLDAYLLKLDKASRDWFADGSPGDILSDKWKSISAIDGVETRGKELLMHCRAGGHLVDLYLSLPRTGGIRLHNSDEGFFKPDDLLKLKIIQSSGNCSFPTPEGKIVINYQPFGISFFDGEEKAKIRIDSNDIAFHFNAGGKVAAVNFTSQLDPAEVIYGFGEKYDRFNENGNVLTLWGMDDWSGNTIGLMNQSYKPIPVFHSSRGYTIFDNSTFRLRADVGKTRPNQYRLTQQGSIFDFYFWISSPEKAIESYTALTGKPILPPKWAFEPWMGRTGRGWAKPSHNAIMEEESVVKHFAELDIPHSAIYSEGSGADSPALNQFMAAHDLKVLSWFYPVISEDKQKSLMPELEPDGLPILNCGDEKQTRELDYVDFSNPNALELCRRWWKHRLDIGVAGSMVDFGDRVPEDAVFFNGKRGDQMHNFYSYDYHKTISEVFREKRGDDFILFGRAAAPGTQKFVAQFAGDHAANFAGLQTVLTGALNLCACGFSTWGSDVGGFLGWPEPAVYMRWVQFGCFSPLMRCHGRTPREPWNYGEAAIANYKFYAWVRENLLDYIYNAAIEAHETGVPIMRSMAVAFPDEQSPAVIKDEYLFGQDLLVAPVVSENSFRTISLPAGKWTSLWSGETIVGPTNLTTDVPLDKIPVYLRQGAIVPVRLNSDLQFGESMSSNQVKVLVITPPDKKSAWTDAQNGKESAQLELKTNYLEISVRNVSKLNYLLVYGASPVKSVELNGKDLLQSDWRMDSTINRLIIHLPREQNSAAKIEVQFQPGDFQ